MLQALLITSIFVNAFITCNAFDTGPPNTEHVCKTMFPEGHHVDSQTKPSPYKISLSMNIYTPWDRLNVTVQASPDYYIKGLFIQARRANCSHPLQNEPLGVFHLKDRDPTLKTMPCLGKINSSISHRINVRLSEVDFQWFAPAKNVGHIYFVATVVHQQMVFWTNVTSEIIRSLETPGLGEKCAMKVLIDSPLINTTPGPSTTAPKSGSSAGPMCSFETIFIIRLVHFYLTYACFQARM